jgi:hypothetical protein
VMFVSGMIYYSMSALLPQGSAYMFTHDPVEVGLIALPAGIVMNLFAWLVPGLVHKIKYPKYQIIAGLVVQTLFNALYAVAVPHNKALWIAFQVFGQNMFVLMSVLAQVIIGLHVSLLELGVATGLMATFRSGGGSFGNAIFSTILNNFLSEQLGPRISGAALSHGFPADGLKALIPAAIADGSGTPMVLADVPDITDEVAAAVRLAFKEAYGYAFQRVCYASIPFGVIAIVCAFFINDPSQYLTNHTAVHMEKQVLAHHKHHDDPQEHHPSDAEI